jgi:hypothetical protein
MVSQRYWPHLYRFLETVLISLFKHLHVSPPAYNTALALYFVAYVLFEVPANVSSSCPIDPVDAPHLHQSRRLCEVPLYRVNWPYLTSVQGEAI